MSIRRILVQQLGSVLRLPLADLDKPGESFGTARFDGIERIYLNTGNRDRRIFVPMRGECHDKNGFDEDMGFECTKCGAMTDGYMSTTERAGVVVQFNYCPCCGAEVMHT